MQVTILLFGILRDIVGENRIDRKVSSGTTLEKLKKELTRLYPKLKLYQNFSLAVNETYEVNDYVIKENDVVALIPPVSGG